MGRIIHNASISLKSLRKMLKIVFSALRPMWNEHVVVTIHMPLALIQIPIAVTV